MSPLLFFLLFSSSIFSESILTCGLWKIDLHTRGTVFLDKLDSVCCLGEMLEFINRGDYHPWKDLPGDGLQRECTFAFCKAMLIKALVEIAGEEKHVDVLSPWDDSDKKQPGDASWTDGAVDQDAQGPKHNHRDDLLVCVSLTLGNLLCHGACSILPSL